MNDWKDSCKVATTGNNISLTGGAPNVLDGIDLAVGDRVLVKDQTAPPGIFSPDNGIYVVSAAGTGLNGTWVRSSDANTSALVTCGLTCSIDNGFINAHSIFQLTSPGNLILGSTGLRFEVTSAPINPVNGNYRIYGGNILQLVDVNGLYRTIYFDANGALQAGPPGP